MKPNERPLPDPDASMRDCVDFICGSQLCRRALSSSEPTGFANLIRDLIESIFRLQQTCHLPEFTDHGLSHLCSLVERLSGWTLAYPGQAVCPLPQQLTPHEAVILLLATLFHDIGMLSQQAEDLPTGEGLVTQPRFDELPNWVRKTHVQRMAGLVKRLFSAMGQLHLLGHQYVIRAIKVAEAHQDWPDLWAAKAITGRDAGLAAALAVADLLDEDSGRCDTTTLLAHRQGNTLNYAHWLRHSLSITRATITEGTVSVSFGKLENTDLACSPIYAALRNHFRLVLLYTEPLKKIGIVLNPPQFSPNTGVPNASSDISGTWQTIRGFATQSSLIFHLLRSFMPEALLDSNRISAEQISKLQEIGLEPVELGVLHEVPGLIEGRSEDEQTFEALLLDDTPTRLNTGAQSAAFAFLRDEARAAHLADEGYRVNHLAAIALTRFCKFHAQNRLAIDLSDIKWAFVLPLYWLVHDYMLHEIHEALEIAAKSKPVSTPLQQVLTSFYSLANQPFATPEDNQFVPSNLNFDWCQTSDAVEDGVLLTHLLELIWVRSRGKQEWLQIVDIWITHCPETHRNALQQLKMRLKWQSRLTRPSSIFPRVSIDEMADISSQFPIARFWLLLLAAEPQSLDNEIQQFNRRNRAQGANARLIFDAHHWNRFYGIFGEAQSIGLTRRLRQTIESPILAYQDARQAQRDDTLCDLYQGNGPQNANDRFHVFRLVQLEELAALRSWSWGDWIAATRAESHALFESCRWLNEDPHFAAKAISLAVRGGALRKLEDNSEFRQALTHLEFAPPQILEDLVADLLDSYPKNRDAAWNAIKELKDIIPESCWPTILQTQVDHINLCRRGEERAANAMPLSFWGPLLHTIPPHSWLWDSLRAEALYLAAFPMSWENDDGFYGAWLKHAPLSLAIELGDTIAERPQVEYHYQEHRTRILGNADLQRKDLMGRYRNRLLSQALDSRQRCQMWPLMTDEQKATLRIEAKAPTVRKLNEFLEKAIPDPSAKYYNIPVEELNFCDIVDWEMKDWPLLERVISIINNDQVISECLPHLLSCLSDMIARGPLEVSEHVLPVLMKWLSSPPVGKMSRLAEASGPFSIFQGTFFYGPGSPRLASELGWVVDAIIGRLGTKAAQALEQWLISLARQNSLGTTHLALRLCIKHISHLSTTSAEVCFNIASNLLHHLIALEKHQPEHGQTLAHSLRQISYALDEELARQSASSILEKLLDSLGPWFPFLAKSTNHKVRVTVAILARKCQKIDCINPIVTGVVEQLKRDNRASVRYAAGFTSN